MNDNQDVDIEHTQIMCCILCHQGPFNVSNIITQFLKINSYYKMNGITSLQNHVDANHAIVAKIFENEVNNSMQRKEKVINNKKTKCVFGICFKKNCCERFLQKKGCAIKKFLENLCLLIVKNNLSIHFVENIYLIKPLALHLCPRSNFLSKKKCSQEILLWLVEKVNQFGIFLHLLILISKCPNGHMMC